MEITYIVFRHFTLLDLLAFHDPFGPWGAYSMASSVERHAVGSRDAILIETTEAL